MARTERNNADYFPYYCKEGKAKHFIRFKYGKDGLVAWTELLILLCVTNHHHIDFKRRNDALFTMSKCMLDEPTMMNFIADLIELGEVDAELWRDYRIVWSQKLVESIQDAYARRKNKCITKSMLIGMQPGSTQKKNETVKKQPKPKVIGDIRVTPPVQIKYKGPDFIDSIIAVWREKYLAHRGEDYEIINAGKERTAAAKIVQMNRNKFPTADADEAVQKIGALFELCLRIEASWFYKNMSMSIIISKFNEIKQYINEESGKNIGRTSKTGINAEQFAEILSAVFDSGAEPTGI